MSRFFLRSTPQFEGPAVIHVLEANKPAAEPVMGAVLHFAGKRLTLDVASGIAPGSPIRIDVSGGLILGEVVGLVPSDNGTSALSVAVDQIIPSMSDLARLVQSVCGARPERESKVDTQPLTNVNEVLQPR